MNCKLNDRAFVTRVRPASAPGRDAAIKAMLGRVVKVVRSNSQNGSPFWELEDPVELPDIRCIITGIEDYCLTPIRDQQDPIEIDRPEALWLALGIRSRSYV